MINIKEINIDEITPYVNNPRKNDNAVDKVAASIKEFGFKVPLVIDKDNTVVTGHTRLKAAKKLGLKAVPCIVAEDLTDAQIKAFRIADNKVNEYSEWDIEKLNIELEGLEELDFDLDNLGFELEELEDIRPDIEVEEDDFDIEIEENPYSKLGDIWLLGNHRLMCGDSTDKEIVGKLMDGVKADMVFTDPPYNINYKGIKDERQIKNDKMSDEDFVKFLESSLMKIDTAYVCCSWQYNHLFKEALENIGMSPKAMIIWNKVNPAQHLDKYFKQHEIIFYYGDFGGQKTIRGDIWECKRQKNTIHPTMKPLELISIALKDNPTKKIIYDGFGGSGSTLIAAEQLNRKCYMMELDEKYVDVIVKRYIEYTGNEDIILIRDGKEINFKDIKEKFYE